jgi:AcrR family transcriptional regulator
LAATRKEPTAPANAAVLPRRERLRLTQRAEILDAALALFVHKGYHNVSMREIAAAAEFATGTLYKFFDSKEALYAELVKKFARTIGVQIVASLDTPGDELQRLKYYIHEFHRILLSNAPAVQLYFSRTLGLAMDIEDPEGEVNRLRQSAFEKLTALIASGTHKGLFRSLDPRTTAASLQGMLEARIFWRLCTTPRSVAEPSCPDIIEQMAASACDLFFHGLMPTTR